MTDIPLHLQKNLYKHIIKDQALVYFLIDDHGKIIEAGGSLLRFNMEKACKGDDIASLLMFMEGMIPLETASLYLPFIEILPGISADVYLFKMDTGYELILLDVTRKEKEKTALLQKANDLSLLREHQEKIITKHLSSEYADQLLGLPDNQAGVIKPVTVLSAGMKYFTDIPEKEYLSAVSETFINTISTIENAISEEGGLVINILGASVIAVFGILPSTLPAEIQALKTAEKLFNSFGKINNKPDKLQQFFDVGIGIASGNALTEIFNIGSRRTFGVIGSCVSLACHLERYTDPGQVIINNIAHANAGSYKEFFTKINDFNRTDDIKAFAGSLNK